MLLQGFGLQHLVAAALALLCQRPRLRHTLADGRAGLPCRAAQQIFGGQVRDFHVQINPVQQRAAELALIACHLVGCAAAGPLCAAPEAAGAGVHGRNQLKACRKLHAVGGAGNRDAPRFQRLAQGFQGAARKLGKLIQKQGAAVGVGNFPRPRRRAATHQRYGTGRVVRAGGTALPPLGGLEAPAQAGDGGTFHRLLRRHGRQQTGKALGQHGFARARRANHQHPVLPGRSNFQCAFGGGLAFDIGHVAARGLGASRRGLQPLPPGACFGQGLLRWQQLCHHIQQMPGAVDVGLRRTGRFRSTVHGQHQPGGDLLQVQRQTGGQCPAHGAQLARQGQLAREFPALQQGPVNLATGRQNAQRNRQIKAARVLGQVGRGQIDSDALVVRKLQPAVGYCAAHPLARFLDFDLGQAHQRKAGQPIGKVHFHSDRRCLQP